MRVLPLGIVIIAIAGVIYAKDFLPELVEMPALEQAQAQAKEAKSRLTSANDKYIQQAKEMNAILNRLVEISGQGAELRLDIENGNCSLSQVEKINSYLDSTQERIDQLERQAAKVRAVDKDLAISKEAIYGLKRTLEAQRNEIDNLRGMIAEKDATIRSQQSVIYTQRDTISSQNSTIVRQRDELKTALWNQTETLYKAARDYEALADNDQIVTEVKGRKDKAAVNAFRREIYGKALDLYRAAARQNHTEALDRMADVSLKMGQLL